MNKVAAFTETQFVFAFIVASLNTFECDKRTSPFVYVPPRA